MIPALIALRLVLGSDARLADATVRVESDGDRTATECPRGRRHRHHDDYRQASYRAPCFCGLFQTTAPSPDLCLLQRAPVLGLASWRAQRADWRRVCHRAHAPDLDLCTIAGYATGGAGVQAAVTGDENEHGVRYTRALFRLASVR